MLVRACNPRGRLDGQGDPASRALAMELHGIGLTVNGLGDGFHRHGGRLADGMVRSAWEGNGLRQWHGQGPTSRASLWSFRLTTRHFSRRVDLDRRIRLIPPPFSRLVIFLALCHVCILGTNTPFSICLLETMRDHT